MALKAGYKGIKKNVLSTLLSLAGLGFSELASPLYVDGGALSIAEATSDDLGIVKPDGTTITVENGVLSAVGSQKVVTPIDFTTLTKAIQNTGVMSVEDTVDTMEFKYTSGNQIGARCYKGIDISAANFIVVELEVTSIYSDAFPVKLGIATTAANAAAGTYAAKLESGVTSEKIRLILDVRGYSGTYYITFDGSGANTVFSDAEIISEEI